MRLPALPLILIFILLMSALFSTRAAPRPGSAYKFRVTYKASRGGLGPESRVGELMALVRRACGGELAYSTYVLDGRPRRVAMSSVSLRELLLSLDHVISDADGDGFAEVFEVDISGPDRELFTGSTFCFFVSPSWEAHARAWLSSAAEVRSFLCVRGVEAVAEGGTFQLAVVAGVEQEVLGEVRQATAVLFLSAVYDEHGVLLDFRKVLHLMFIGGRALERKVEVSVSRLGQVNVMEAVDLALSLLPIVVASELMGAFVVLRCVMPQRPPRAERRVSGCASS
mgnify:CR=1 FL=1